jgi:hypothetical protein
VESLSTTTPEYRKEQQNFHNLKHQKSVLEMKKKTMEIEAGDDERSKRGLEKIQSRMIRKANEEIKHAQEAADQYCAMRKNAVFYSRKMLANRPNKESMARDTKAFLSALL